MGLTESPSQLPVRPTGTAGPIFGLIWRLSVFLSWSYQLKTEVITLRIPPPLILRPQRSQETDGLLWLPLRVASPISPVSQVAHTSVQVAPGAHRPREWATLDISDMNRFTRGRCTFVHGSSGAATRRRHIHHVINKFQHSQTPYGMVSGGLSRWRRTLDLAEYDLKAMQNAMFLLPNCHKSKQPLAWLDYGSY